MFIPVNEPRLNGNELKYVTDCITSGWISSEGSYVKDFEQTFAKTVNRKHAIAVSNGSAALDVAVVALDIGQGDEVIMPTFTIISCATAIVRAGAKPVLVDADAETWNMDVSQIENKITPNTKAIMVVHIYGLPVDMDKVMDLAKKYNLKVIEDTAEVHGQTYKGKLCGSFGDISTFSFYPNKHITTGEGGMVVCNDDKLAEKCKSLRNLCFLPHRRFYHEEMGWNLRLTNVQAAIGLAQIEQLEEHIKLKRIIGNSYNTELEGTEGIQLPLKKNDAAENIYWVYAIVLKNGQDAEAVMKALGDNQIGSRPFFLGMHEQPVFHKMGLFKDEKYPVAEYIARHGFYIPSGLGLDLNKIPEIANVLKKIIKNA
jgi:perosamine synthetase